MKDLKELIEMLTSYSENKNVHKIVLSRQMFDSKLITYSEYVVLKEYILDNNL